MRIYVGTLYAGENEFDECVAAIKRQTHRNFEHFVFSGLGNAEAHAALYNDFAAKRDSFDLLIKVDADMVIQNDRLFEQIEEQFLSRPLNLYTIAVHDWFTDRLICGLNTYRNGTVWQGDQGGLFVDNVRNPGSGVETDWDRLAPAALHCPNPSPFQAFHFGLHKAMKVIQPYPSGGGRVHWRMREHWDNIEATERHFERSGDRRLGLAILGAELVFSGRFAAEHISYNQPKTNEIFLKYSDLSAAAIKKEIRWMKLRSGGWLPAHMRRAWLWYHFRAKRLSLYALRTLLQDCLLPGRFR